MLADLREIAAHARRFVPAPVLAALAVALILCAGAIAGVHHRATARAALAAQPTSPPARSEERESRVMANCIAAPASGVVEAVAEVPYIELPDSPPQKVTPKKRHRETLWASVKHFFGKSS